VDQTPKDVSAFHLGGESGDAGGVGGDWYGESDAAVRTLLVVVGDRCSPPINGVHRLAQLDLRKQPGQHECHCRDRHADQEHGLDRVHHA